MSENVGRSKWVLLLTSLGFFMAMMDTMIVTTASTAIRTQFQISVRSLQWALNAYNITIAAVLLIGVTLGERLGRRKIYNWGILVFTLGSILCALAPNISWLIIARIIEGIGASVMTPMSMSILTNSLPASQRGRALGIWGGIGGLALIVGPSLGGLIVAQLAWQWIFWINVPVGGLAILLSRRHLPESYGQNAPINLVDNGLIIIAMAGIVWALSAVNGSGGMLALMVGGMSLVAGGWFIRRQSQETMPMVPLALFRNKTFVGGNLATAGLYGSMYGVVFFLPQYLQVSQQANALTAGLELLPWTGTLVVVAPFAGRAVDRFGERWVATIGLGLQGLGYLLIALLVRQSYSWLIVPLMLAGIGLSMAGPALQKSVLGAVPSMMIGKASGVYNVFRLLGGAVGTTVAVMIFYQFHGSTFTNGFQATMLGAASMSLVGIVWSRRLHLSKTLTTEETTDFQN
ncbi:DHA2 family efflux MFS transporter permease subunit [Levilactobacillus yiduensis]|uniref:DHA2 family efflux MFS transporter permease subunit n=1 Tax=Levilactobacillus yiduensis TaxID=2953880 RepID=UPI000EF2F115|nr:DHA2 family efflux MFS transporter permease subunit [Levilactobacillus yiduensis]AYM02878.1 DHA2 family efflux MFS transporter permease subunit [Levilactobacillus brevis]